jgi:hypothetical protein
MLKNIVCLLSDFDDYPLISAKLPILTDACFYYNFSRNNPKKQFKEDKNRTNGRKNKE